MDKIFDADQLLSLAKNNKEQYINSKPFPHIIFDNFMNKDILKDVVNAFPTENELEFYRYENPIEKKLAYDQISRLPDEIAQVLIAMNMPVFLRFLEELTGLNGLIPDPYYRGGGIHQIVRGGKSDIHLDFNEYQKLNLRRKVNALLYLNEDWQESYGGHLELWSGHQEDAMHVLDQCEERILPLFNRLVVFTTTENAYHGHPDRLTCPKHRTRKSLATYYYLAEPAEVAPKPRRTTFIRRPHDPYDDEVETIRAKRNQGRLSSNVKSEFVADK